MLLFVEEREEGKNGKGEGVGVGVNLGLGLFVPLHSDATAFGLWDKKFETYSERTGQLDLTNTCVVGCVTCPGRWKCDV